MSPAARRCLRGTQGPVTYAMFAHCVVSVRGARMRQRHNHIIGAHGCSATSLINARLAAACVIPSTTHRLSKVARLARCAQRMCAHRALCRIAAQPMCANPCKQLRIAKPISKGNAPIADPIGAQLAVQCARRPRSELSCTCYSSAVTATLQSPSAALESASQMLSVSAVGISSR